MDESDISTVVTDADPVAYAALVTGQNALLQSQVDKLTLELASLEDERNHYKRLAQQDELTGLFNKRYFDAHLDREIALSHINGSPLSLAFLDINDFKRFNTVYGHDGGDEVIRQVADYVGGEVQDYGLVARLHGDEFALALPSFAEFAAVNLCRGLRAGVENLKIVYDKQVISTTATFGVKQLEHGEDRRELFIGANKAFYRGQDLGKNCVVEYSSLGLCRNAIR
tara:strand:- start:19 stop:696 length:678 start_codon:yes stop_codon:yes gene_type:complete